MLAGGDAGSLSCLFRFQFWTLCGFSSEEELVLILGFCGGDLGVFSPLPTHAAILGLGLGPRGCLCQRCSVSRLEGAGVVLRLPHKEAPSEKTQGEEATGSQH